MDLWYHGSRSLITRFRDDENKGIHFGTMAQARMRNSAFVHEVSIASCPEARARDRQSWVGAVRRARGKGVGVLKYLNRFEGIPVERFDDLLGRGEAWKLDEIPDAQFKKLVPEAEFSIVVTDPYLITLHRVLDRSGEVVWQRAAVAAEPTEPADDWPQP